MTWRGLRCQKYTTLALLSRTLSMGCMVAGSVTGAAAGSLYAAALDGETDAFVWGGVVGATTGLTIAWMADDQESVTQKNDMSDTQDIDNPILSLLDGD